MLYLKTEIDGRMQDVDIYDDEIYTTCFQCGKEFQVESDLIKSIYDNDLDLASTSFSCGCKTKERTLIRIK